MLKSIKQLLKKISGFFAVSESKYNIDQIGETAGSYGMAYRLTDTATGESWNIYVRRRDNVFDLSDSITQYGTYTLTGRRKTHGHSGYVWKGSEQPLDFEHHESLVSYFEGRGFKVIRRFPPHPADTAPINGDLNELNAA